MGAKSVALISGKGGSGKTTISICMAKMIADSGKRVLLIDCDLSTCGATYFYEDQINNVSEKIMSFTDLLGYVTGNSYISCSDTVEAMGMNRARYLCVENNMLFIPSIIPSDLRTNHFDDINIKKYLDKFCDLYNDYIKPEFDIVIFDCQAGYSSVLDLVLPISDNALLVMEADAISSAAARNLYIRIASSVQKTKMYQVFSKVTEKEKRIYGQVMLGTFYTTIEAVLFDLNVRKAFGLAEVPDLMNTMSEFGMQIYNICTAVFSSKEMKLALSTYYNVSRYNILRGKIEESRPSKLMRYTMAAVPVFAYCIIVSLLFSSRNIGIINGVHVSIYIVYISSFILGMMLAYLAGMGAIKKAMNYRQYRLDMRHLLMDNPELEVIIKKYQDGNLLRYQDNTIKEQIGKGVAIKRKL